MKPRADPRLHDPRRIVALALDRRPRRRSRLPSLRARRGSGLGAGRREGRRPDPRGLRLRHGAGQLRGRLRHARRAREPRRPAVAADRAAGHPHPRPLGRPRGAALPARGWPRRDQHEVRKGEPVRGRPRRRPRRLSRSRRLSPARLPRGRVRAEALDRLLRREVLPRVRRRLPRLRGLDSRTTASTSPATAWSSGSTISRPRAGARLRPHRPRQRERRAPATRWSTPGATRGASTGRS